MPEVIGINLGVILGKKANPAQLMRKKMSKIKEPLTSIVDTLKQGVIDFLYSLLYKGLKQLRKHALFIVQSSIIFCKARKKVHFK